MSVDLKFWPIREERKPNWLLSTVDANDADRYTKGYKTPPQNVPKLFWYYTMKKKKNRKPLLSVLHPIINFSAYVEAFEARMERNENM